MQPWQPAVSSGIEEPDDTGDLPPVPPGADLASARLHWLLPLAVFAITFLIYASLIPRILRYSSPPTGDQPSYLMITNSIVEDGDLNLANNFAEVDEDKFYELAPRPEDFVGMSAPYPLPPHRGFSVARPPEELYSFHWPGLSVLLVPAWIAGGLFSLWWPATIVFICIVGALVAANVFLLAHELTGKLWIALAVWLPVAFSSPIMTYTFLIFTELTTGLLLIFAFRRLALGWDANGPARLLLVGACIGYIPWLAWRNVPIAAGLGLYAVVQWWRSTRSRADSAMETEIEEGTASARSSIASAFIFLLPLLTFGTLLAGYHLFLFGSIMPVTKVPELGDNPIFYWPWAGGENLVRFAGTSMGLLFDRNSGLLVYAPIYLLAIVGAIAMFRSSRRADRRLLLFIAIVAVPYTFMIASYHFWNGSWSPPARMITMLAPLFAAPLAMSLQFVPGILYKLIYGLLAVPGWILVAVMMNDPRLLWPSDAAPAYSWLAVSDQLPIRLNLVPFLSSFDVPDQVRHPATTAGALLLGAGVVFLSYLLMQRHGRVSRSWSWSPRAHTAIWLAIVAVSAMGWYSVNAEYLKHKTVLTEQFRIAADPPMQQPHGIAFRDNKVYVPDYTGNSIGVFDLQTRSFSLLSPTAADGPVAFTGPTDITEGPGDLLYVLNNGEAPHGILAMRADGRVVKRLLLNGKSGIAAGLSIGPTGEIHVADTYGGVARRYGPDGGDPAGEWGGENGRFNNIHDLVVAEDGTMYVAESSGKRILKLASGGGLQQWDVPCNPYYMQIDGRWLDFTCSGSFYSLNMDTGVLQQARTGENSPLLASPYGLSHGPDSMLYIMDGQWLVAYKVTR